MSNLDFRFKNVNSHYFSPVKVVDVLNPTILLKKAKLMTVSQIKLLKAFMISDYFQSHMS